MANENVQQVVWCREQIMLKTPVSGRTLASRLVSKVQVKCKVCKVHAGAGVTVHSLPPHWRRWPWQSYMRAETQALQIVQELLRQLRDSGVLSREHVEALLTNAGEPLAGETRPRFGKAHGLIEQVREALA